MRAAGAGALVGVDVGSQSENLESNSLAVRSASRLYLAVVPKGGKHERVERVSRCIEM